MKGRVWKKKNEWERKGMVRLEEWLSMDERKRRHEAIKKIKELAKELRYESSNIEIKEWKRERYEEGEKMDVEER